MKASKILVITSRDNFTWWSMQEIIPAIEEVWKLLARKKWADIKIVDVSDANAEELEKVTRQAAKVDHVVATASTPSVVKCLTNFRKNGINKPFFIYIHGDSTSGFMAFKEFKDQLTRKDSFVVSCDSDAYAVRDSFKDPNIIQLPFPLADAMKVEKVLHEKGSAAQLPLLYVGRVSEQKNLHTLLFSIWILRNYFNFSNVTLDIYGSEDGYGSPNMGQNFPNYSTYLKGLSLQLGIQRGIRWHGYKQREFLEKVVKDNRYVFVSPTLHSDENFGSSILASLMQGSQVVATRWGGHTGFAPFFSRQLFLVPVHGSEDGPYLNPFELAQYLLRAHENSLVHQDKIATRKAAQKEFSVAEGAKKLMRVFRAGTSQQPLESAALLKMICDQKRDLKFPGQKLFSSYSDKLGHAYFRAYGMTEVAAKTHASGIAGKVIIPPWVHKYRNDIRVCDPHRGTFTFPPCINGFPGTVYTAPDLTPLEMPLNVIFNLLKKGFAFPSIELKEKKRGISRPRQSSVGIKRLPPEL